MIAVIASFLLFPLIFSVIYAFVWPTVPKRAGLFVTLGTVIGLLVTVAVLFWVALPLGDAGIAQARPSVQASTFWSAFGPHFISGALLEVVGVGLVLLLLARWLRPR